MLYRIVKVLMTIGLRFFYRHIHVTGFNNIPAEGAAILIANHPSSLMDAAIIGILSRRPVYYFTRGDVFVNAFVTRILSWLHMMPVHPHEGGRKTISVNNESFVKAEEILARGGVIVFFPESTSHTEHQLYPLRKGVFRLAFQTAIKHNFAFEIPLVPIGITYFHPTAARSSVMVHAGKPLLLSAYEKHYQENAAATVLAISKDAWHAIAKCCLHQPDASRLSVTEQQLILERNKLARSGRWKIENTDQLIREQMMCRRISQLNDDNIRAAQLAGENYFEELRKYGLKDEVVSAAGPSIAGLIMLAPVHVVGMILNSLPVAVARKIADEKVYRKDFYAWIFVSCYTVLYTIWFALLTVVLACFGWPQLVAGLITITVTGLCAYWYTGALRRWRYFNRWRSLTPAQQSSILSLRKKASLAPQLQAIS